LLWGCSKCPQSPKKHVFGPELPKNPSKTALDTLFVVLGALKYLQLQKKHVFGPELPKNSSKTALDTLSMVLGALKYPQLQKVHVFRLKIVFFSPRHPLSGLGSTKVNSIAKKTRLWA